MIITLLRLDLRVRGVTSASDEEMRTWSPGRSVWRRSLIRAARVRCEAAMASIGSQ